MRSSITYWWQSILQQQRKRNKLSSICICKSIFKLKQWAFTLCGIKGVLPLQRSLSALCTRFCFVFVSTSGPRSVCGRAGKIDGAVLSDGALIIALAELRDITPVSHFLLLSLSRCCAEAQILCPFDLFNCSVYLFCRAFVLPRLPECRRPFRLPTEKTLVPSDTPCPASSVGRMNNVRWSSRI